ncbi:hypothetical protein jhhlp_007675 [Lomentospora prolificans]|uniref:Uncharacterized protein n=1 Tax=Lomentospora prolificans TaxID=41688 RepID=A0A2N3N089_9PEZI|nr:hypothetical protein jhhlp_007675 [Lomentospora prolificans]
MVHPSTPSQKFIFKARGQGGQTQGAGVPAVPSPRFTTPRFRVPSAESSHSTPPRRPTQLFVQPTSRTRSRDEIESSPPTSHGYRESPVAHQIQRVGDVSGDDEDGEDSGIAPPTNRDTKRRRFLDAFGELEKYEQIESSPIEEKREDRSPTGAPALEGSSQVSSSGSGSSLDLLEEPRSAASRQPVFQPPPRFSLPDSGEDVPVEELPPVFSPQRRLAKYVAGGLAVEVQTWLSQIKVSRQEGEAVLRFQINELQEGGRMYLTSARAAIDIPAPNRTAAETATMARAPARAPALPHMDASGRIVRAEGTEPCRSFFSAYGP